MVVYGLAPWVFGCPLDERAVARFNQVARATIAAAGSAQEIDVFMVEPFPDPEHPHHAITSDLDEVLDWRYRQGEATWYAEHVARDGALAVQEWRYGRGVETHAVQRTAADGSLVATIDGLLVVGPPSAGVSIGDEQYVALVRALLGRAAARR
jgi:hypothetical protein